MSDLPERYDPADEGGVARVTLSLPDDDIVFIRQQAILRGLTPSQYVEHLLREDLGLAPWPKPTRDPKREAQ